MIASLIAAPSLVLLGRADEALAVADQGIAVRMEHLDDGDLWPVSHALREWTPTVETKVGALVQAAIS